MGWITTTAVTCPAGNVVASMSTAQPPAGEDDESSQSPHHRGLSLTEEQVTAILARHLPMAGGCTGLERIAIGFN